MVTSESAAATVTLRCVGVRQRCGMLGLTTDPAIHPDIHASTLLTAMLLQVIVVAIHYEPYLSGTNLVYESETGT